MKGLSFLFAEGRGSWGAFLSICFRVFLEKIWKFVKKRRFIKKNNNNKVI